jgi:hypothetical protein
MTACRLPALNSIASAFLLALIPLSALAADMAVGKLDLGNLRFWGVLAAVQAVTLVGYCASSLPQWAGWVDGTALVRLTIIQGVVTSLMAGNIAFFTGLYYAGLTEIVALMAAGAGGFGGDKFLVPVLQRLFGKATGEKP